MTESDFISVIIPVYNRADIIRGCIENILEQTHKNFEVIVVDDGSSDGTADIVDSVSDVRVKKCIRLDKNRGACYARNLGATMAQGEYIAFQDSDDLWAAEKLEKQLLYLKRKGGDMVFCAMLREDLLSGRQKRIPDYPFDDKGNIQTQLLLKNCISTQCILIKRRAFESILFDEKLKRFQDWDFAVRAAEVIKIGYLSEMLVFARLQENSISKVVPMSEALHDFYKKHYEKISADKTLHVTYLRMIGNAYFQSNPEKAKGYYEKCLKLTFNPKIFVKLMICKIK